jgi:hypothetical protein
MSIPYRYLATALLAALVASVSTYLAVPPVIAPVSVDVHVPDVVQVRVPVAEKLAARDAADRSTAAVAVAGGVTDTGVSQATAAAGKFRPVRRLAYNLCRSRVSAELQRTGFAAAGGDPTPLKRSEADAMAERLTDRMLDAAGGVYGAPFADDRGDEPGPVLAFVLGILEWLKANPQFIEFLLSLLMFL